MNIEGCAEKCDETWRNTELRPHDICHVLRGDRCSAKIHRSYLNQQRSRAEKNLKVFNARYINNRNLEFLARPTRL